jgi:hypothetical protein
MSTPTNGTTTIATTPRTASPTPAPTIDRAALLRLCRLGVAVVVESRSSGGVDCVARGRVMAVTERHLTLETRGLQTIVALSRVTSIESVETAEARRT